jgi:hypothetical protein
MNGKGDDRRPEDKAKFDAGYTRIFKNPFGTTIIVCAECEEQVTVASAGDESLDYCATCERIVEGNTKEIPTC